MPLDGARDLERIAQRLRLVLLHAHVVARIAADVVVEVVRVGVARRRDDVAVLEEREPIVDHAVDRSPLRVLVAVEHLDGVEVVAEAGPRRLVAARVEPAEVEVADLAVDARMVHVDDGVGRARAHVAEEVLGPAAVHEHRALADALEVVRQRPGAEVAPAVRRQLVADGAGEVAPDADLLDHRRVVADDVVVGRGDELDAVGDELVDAVVHRHVRVGRVRRRARGSRR